MKKTTFISQAAEHYKAGDYQRALSLYQQAGKIIGSQFVQANIQLCQQHLGIAVAPTSINDPLGQPTAPPNLQEQLSQTQALLEEYHQRYQQCRIDAMEKH